MHAILSKPRTRINLTPFCKVCFDAGKPTSVYSSHYTRENPAPGSKVVCPLLLSQKCNYCHKPGHTIRYCSILRKNKQLKNDVDVQIHIDIEREMRNGFSHIENQQQHPNDTYHPDTLWFPIPIIPNTAASTTGQGSGDSGDDNFTCYWGTNLFTRSASYTTPPISPENNTFPGAPLKRKRIDQESQ